MIRYGGESFSGKFRDEMDVLKGNGDQLHKLNVSSGTGGLSLDQMGLVQAISSSINNLDRMAGEFDDYRREQNSVWQFLRTIRNPHRAPLSELAQNIDHFALYGSVGMTIDLNKKLKSLSVRDQQKLLKSLQWTEQISKKDPKRVYQDLGEFFTRMSQHSQSSITDSTKPYIQDERQSIIHQFFTSTLSTSSDQRDELSQSLKDFSKHVLAGKTKGANSTIKLIRQLQLDDRTILNGVDGIVDIAMLKLKNFEGQRSTPSKSGRYATFFLFHDSYTRAIQNLCEGIASNCII